MAESKGVWLDKDTGKVVNSAPERGRQLVAPGKDLDKAKVDAIVARYTAEPDDASDSGDAKTVTTSTAKK